MQYRVYPAYQKLIDYFNGILPKTTTDDGVWKCRMARPFTRTLCGKNDDPAQAGGGARPGCARVTRIEAEMRAILDANGYTGRPIGEALEALGRIRVSSSRTMTRAGRSVAEYTASLRRRWSGLSRCS